VNDRRRAAIRAEIVKLTSPPPLREWYQITASEHAQDESCERKTAKRRLEKLVAAGQLRTEERTIENGQVAQVWWRPEDEEREGVDA